MEVRSWQATNDIFIIDVKPGFWNLNHTMISYTSVNISDHPNLYTLGSEERYLKYRTQITRNHRDTIGHMFEDLPVMRR